MSPQTLPNTTIHGLSIRTINRLEMSPESSKIIPLWQRFSQEIAPRLNEGAQCYGVYCHFESDETGEFDVVAGTDETAFADDSEMVTVTLSGKQYLAFPVADPLPQGIMSTWMKIWQYFAEDDCPYQRAFVTDVEHYRSNEEAIIYISVK